jgi:hypothetical protein
VVFGSSNYLGGIEQTGIMANHLPSTLDFAKTEEEICAKWAAENTFKRQDSLSLERGDKVRAFSYTSRERDMCCFNNCVNPLSMCTSLTCK